MHFAKAPVRHLKKAFSLPGLFLLLLVLVIPAAQVISGVPDAVGWQVLVYALYAIGLLVTLVFPWLGDRWARRLVRDLSVEHPTAIVSLVNIWRESRPAVFSGVLLADERGVEIHDPLHRGTGILWHDVSSIETVQHGRLARESIHITGSSGALLLRFVPMSTSGIEALSPQKYADFASRFRRLMHAGSAGSSEPRLRLPCPATESVVRH